MHIRVLLFCLTGVLLSACRSHPPAQAGNPDGSISLLEQRLLETIAMQEQLDAAAAQPDADSREIQRLFQQVSREYEGIIARNPDHLETRLIYGKLLSQYGDSEGARVQFLMAARIDPKIAVIHQQLSTYYAEERDHTRALAYALNAVELEPETAAYHFGLGQLLAAFREEFLNDEVFTPEQLDAEMLGAFRKAAELEPDTLPFQMRTGEAFYDVAEPDWQAALAHWEALAARPGLTPLQADAIRLHTARCLVELDRTAEAQAQIDAVESPELQSSAAAILAPGP